MALSRVFGVLKWAAGLFLATVLLAVLFISIVGWNWLREPIERRTLAKTGRTLVIKGDLQIALSWPRPHLHASGLSFSNPGWAREKQMIEADAVDVSIDLPQLLMSNIVLPDVRLEQPIIFLERGVGDRKNWLLDMTQQDEQARVRIDRLVLNHGRLGYDDVAQRISIRSEISSTGPNAGLAFTAQGQYKGLALKASGSGGPVLGLHDETTPYALQADIAVGDTRLAADGTITSLSKFAAMDMQLSLRGDSLAHLYPLLGIAFPETPVYVAHGHLVHSGHSWRYEKFSGRVGGSDIAGTLQVNTGGKRPAMTAELVSRVLDVADLGPSIGSRPGRLKAAAAAPRTASPVRVLPDIPFKTDRWNSLDAEVTLKAGIIRHAKSLPLDNIQLHLSLRDSLLTLDPLNLGVAGGHIHALISLDGRSQPIQARARARVRGLLIAQLLPTMDLNKTSMGQINGEFDLVGSGTSVGGMLATSSGKAGLVISDGEISKLMMETVGLHLWEILQLKLGGDKRIKLRCAVADFEVRRGAMKTDALIFDTEVTTITGTGTINLERESLDLTLNSKTKDTSPLSLRSPIFIRGSFARPEVGVDKGRVAMRGLGALALGIANPFLALIPLIDAGPGKDSDCARLVHEARKKTGAFNEAG